MIRNYYQNEHRIAIIARSFALITILISCLGLLGLVSFMVEKRTKEIGIRKVLGASVLGILGLLNKEYIKWIVIANIFAWPIAYFTLSKWLQNFAYRTDLTIWQFLASGLLTLLIALLTISWQAIRAAIANPVESLRYE